MAKPSLHNANWNSRLSHPLDPKAMPKGFRHRYGSWHARLGANLLHARPCRRPAPRPQPLRPPVRIGLADGNRVSAFKERDQLDRDGHGSEDASLPSLQALEHDRSVREIDGLWRERKDLRQPCARICEHEAERPHLRLGASSCVEKRAPLGSNEVFSVPCSVEKHKRDWRLWAHARKRLTFLRLLNSIRIVFNQYTNDCKADNCVSPARSGLGLFKNSAHSARECRRQRMPTLCVIEVCEIT
jgi:hypothetical protein